MASGTVMGGTKWSELFPTRFSVVIFILYMVLSVITGLIVTASRKGEQGYRYNTVLAVFCTELLKLSACLGVYIKDEGISKLLPDIRVNLKLLGLYMVPAFLYCMYNNLTFVNLASYDPTTYFLLMQLRVVLTGVVFQIFFKKRLSAIQWASLIVLTIGCILKHVGPLFSHISESATPSHSASSAAHTFATDWSDWGKLSLIFVQVMCSCVAGVYNEYLLKDTGVNTPVMLQNTFLYGDSLLANLLAMAALGSPNSDSIWDVFSGAAFQRLLSMPAVVALILNNACLGIITSLFLRSLNSVLKNFASALEVVLTALLCLILFGTPIDGFTAASIVVVIGASVTYSRNPVVNLGKGKDAEPPEGDKLQDVKVNGERR